MDSHPFSIVFPIPMVSFLGIPCETPFEPPSCQGTQLPSPSVSPPFSWAFRRATGAWERRPILENTRLWIQTNNFKWMRQRKHMELIATDRKLEYRRFFPKFLTMYLEYGPHGAFIWKLRISSQALSYILWLRRCSKIRPNFKFSLLCDFFINFPDFPDSARIWFPCCCRTFLSFFPSLFDLSMHDKFWHFVKISINHQTTKTPSKPCFAMF